jgi:tRNA (guanine26-N2/guanine27-N2)-dimethyltransferase
METLCPHGFSLVIEGLARFCAPDESLYRRPNGVYEPSLAPVFYNPEMVENRDVTMVTLKTFLVSWSKEFTFLDPMAATGVRGIRFILEVAKGSSKSVNVYMGDISPTAVELMKHNLKISNASSLSNVYVQISLMDANEYMYYLKRLGITLNYIDIDPFGAPLYYIHAALQSICNGGMLGITATDVAVLEGKYPNTLLRRYSVKGLKSLISKEVAVRSLLSFAMRSAAAYDKYIKPLLSYHIKHYVRVFVKVFTGATKASVYLNKCIGKMQHCLNCGFSYFEELNNATKEAKCPLCGESMIVIGPLWICDLIDYEYVKKTLNIVSEMPWLSKSSINLLTMLSNTNTSVPTIRLTYIAKRLKLNVPPRDIVIECIRSYEYDATLSMYYHDGINTNAPADIIVQCISKDHRF